MAEKDSITGNPKFFCENCGKEVRRNAKTCPGCGRFFASVRCPSCGYFGGSSEFSNGCPRCGYAVNSGSSKNTKTNMQEINKKSVSPYKTNGYDDPLPWWIYSIVFAIAIFLIAIIISRQ